MVDLGKYATTVLSAYAVTILLIAALVGLSLWKAARMRRALHEQEQRMGRGNG